MINVKISWVWGDGGPHLLMEKRYINVWVKDTAIEQERKPSLYDKIGELDGDYIGKFILSDGSFIVIKEEMDQTTWISSEGGDGGILVGSNGIEKNFDETDFIETVKKIPNDVYDETGIQYEVSEGELYLFPACDLEPGYSNPYNKVNLIPGLYKIKIVENYESCYGNFILYKLIRV